RAARRRDSSFEVEDIRALGPLHAALVILLPDRGPRPAVDIRHLERDHGAGRDRRRAAFDRKDRLDAFDEDERIAFLETADLLEIPHDANRLHERFGVVKDALVIEPDEAAVLVAVRRVDLDRLQLAREL